MMRDHLLRSGASLEGSLVGYYLAKDSGRDNLPAIMLGGFAAGCLAEWIIYNQNAK